MSDDPLTFHAEGCGLETLVATLLAGEIALSAKAPFAGEYGQGITVHIGIDPATAIRLGEWLIAAGRVASDPEAFRAERQAPPAKHGRLGSR